VGNTFTEIGTTLQVPFPGGVEHVRLTVLVNPLTASTLVRPKVEVLPAFTVGKPFLGRLRTKSAVVETFTVNAVFSGAGAPEVLA
jgi:hypothetical protein